MLIILAIVLLIAAALFVIYEWYFQPLVAILFGTPKTYQGLDLFYNEEYLHFQGGESFCDTIERIAFLEDIEPREFYYTDNSHLDNLFHGEFMDFYSLEYNPKEQYAELVADVKKNGSYYGSMTGFGPGTIYELEQYTTPEGRLLVIFDDTEELFAIVYIYNIYEDGIIDGSFIRRYSCLDWVHDYVDRAYQKLPEAGLPTEPKTGDGSAS